MRISSSLGGSTPNRVTLRLYLARFWPVRIRWAIAGLVVLSMLLLATLMLTIGLMGTQQFLLQSASKAALDAGALTLERSRTMIMPVAATLRTLSYDALTQATTLDDRLDRLDVLAAELVANELISSIFIAYPDGDFLLLRPLDRRDVRERFNAPPRANYLLQTVTRRADGSRAGELRFLDAQLTVLEYRYDPEYQFDPRTRPWYQSSHNTVLTVATKPYIFFSTRQVGITLSQLTRNAEATLGIDMALDDIATHLGTLRLTQRTELVLVDLDGTVNAYRDMERVINQDQGSLSFNHLDDLQVSGLSALWSTQPPLLEPVSFRSEGEQWLGVILPFDVLDQDLRLLVAVPNAELLGGLAETRNRLLYIAVLAVLAFLPLGWWAGNRIGYSLHATADQAQSITYFNFSHASRPQTSFHEVNILGHAIDQLSETIEAFLDISQILGSEPRVETMLSEVLTKLVNVTRCRGGMVYLWDAGQSRMQAAARVGVIDGEDSCAYCPERPASRASAPAHSGPESPDCVQIELELRGRNSQLQGLLRLSYSADTSISETQFLDFAKRLSGMLAVAIETRQLIDGQRQLLDAIIRVMADAIDAKSPYTGGHCERVPQLATLIINQLHDEAQGRYADFQLSDDEREAFYLGAWLHDCGKVTSPEHIVDKATKLEVIYNRIHEIRMRFEVLWRDATIAHLQRINAGMDPLHSSLTLMQRQADLREDFAFVASCNIGGEFLADAAIERLQRIGQYTWLRYFDHRLGLSIEERCRLQQADAESTALPVVEFLLADRPEQRIPWGKRHPPVVKDDPGNRYGFDMVLPDYRQNMGELYNLAIRRGTLTAEDRFAINDHIVQTLIMLNALPWPPHLARVPDIAANHHEKMDGNGYPRRLAAAQLQLPDRVMAIADIFEALTAADRPYKPAKTLTESLRIMAFMCKDQHIDTELFRYFLHSRLWLEYAQRYLLPEQIDNVDIAVLEALLPAAEEDFA